MSAENDRPASAEDIVQALDAAIDALLAWIADWHAPAMSAAAEEPTLRQDESLRHLDAFDAWFDANRRDGIVDQPSLRRLHLSNRKVRNLAAGFAAMGPDVAEADYRALMAEVRSFVAQARRLERAFAAASSDLDTLTGVQNRHAMKRALDAERARFIRTGETATLALCDLDHFKEINDLHGHAAGDKVLSVAAGRLAENVRAYDQVFRYGGEEFLILLPDTEPATALAVLERLRKRLAAMPVPIGNGASVMVTASFGLARIGPDEPVEAAVERADAALYRAKKAGRNRVEAD